ncbi:hypothetical protein [Streptomyces tirandamycinicus]|uniref:hypothetical protein n=1 Tax=Streptomyces tirandamycinicus TaxID=2174846 RepID=UPI001ABFA495|nr:hypothetical protein [Streptomyces tirandamycinicus]
MANAPGFTNDVSRADVAAMARALQDATSRPTASHVHAAVRRAGRHPVHPCHLPTGPPRRPAFKDDATTHWYLTLTAAAKSSNMEILATGTG